MNQALRDYFDFKFHTTQKFKDKMKWKINVFRNAVMAYPKFNDEEIFAILKEIDSIVDEISSLKIIDQRELSSELCFIYYFLYSVTGKTADSFEFIKKSLVLPLSFFKENEMRAILKEEGLEDFSNEKVDKVYLLANMENYDGEIYYFYIPGRDCIFTDHTKDPFNQILALVGINHKINVDKTFLKVFSEDRQALEECENYVQDKLDEFRKNKNI